MAGCLRGAPKYVDMQAERLVPEQADARIRTADPFITSEVLYQLSYVGNTDAIQKTVARSCVHHSGAVRAGIVSAWR